MTSLSNALQISKICDESTRVQNYNILVDFSDESKSG